MVSKPLCELRNIGKTVSTRLHGIGIANEAKLKRLGEAKAKPRLSAGLGRSNCNWVV